MTAKAKKLYMLYDLIPSKEITGGVWYSGLEFDRVSGEFSLTLILPIKVELNADQKSEQVICVRCEKGRVHDFRLWKESKIRLNKEIEISERKYHPQNPATLNSCQHNLHLCKNLK